MKSFLDNRQEIGSPTTGKVSGGTGFSSMKASSGFNTPEPTVKIDNPDGEDAPQVELVREGDVVTHIIVSFGDKKVEIKCNY